MLLILGMDVVNPRMIGEGYMEAMSKRMDSVQENMPRTNGLSAKESIIIWHTGRDWRFCVHKPC